MLEFSEALKVFFIVVCIGVLCIAFFIYIVRRKQKKASCYDLNLTLAEIIDIKLQMKQEEEEPVSDELIEKLKNALN